MIQLNPFNEQKNNNTDSDCNSCWKYCSQNKFYDEEAEDVP